MVVARMEVKFGKVLSPTDFIQKVMYDGMGNLFLMVTLLREQKSGHMHQVASFLRTMTIRE
jgi:hypothetical protein